MTRGRAVAICLVVGALAALVVWDRWRAGGEGGEGRDGAVAGVDADVPAARTVVVEPTEVPGLPPIDVPIPLRDASDAAGALAGGESPAGLLAERGVRPADPRARLRALLADPGLDAALLAEALHDLLRGRPDLAADIVAALAQETAADRAFALARALRASRRDPAVRATLLDLADRGSAFQAEAALMALHGDDAQDARRRMLDAAAARTGGAREAAIAGLVEVLAYMPLEERLRARESARRTLTDGGAAGAHVDAMELLVRGADADPADRARLAEVLRSGASSEATRLHALRLLAERAAKGAGDAAAMRADLARIAEDPATPALLRAVASTFAATGGWDDPALRARLEEAAARAMGGGGEGR